MIEEKHLYYSKMNETLCGEPRERFLTALLDFPVDAFCPVCVRKLLEDGGARDYDHHIRMLIATVQAFILHHRYPESFAVPDLENAESAWRAANEFNLKFCADSLP